MITIEQRKAMKDDPEFIRRAEERAASIKVDLGRVNYLARKAYGETTPRRKIVVLHKLADLVGEAAKGKVPCDKGCSHCCYQPVFITHAEATYIAEQTGHQLHLPEKWQLESDLDKHDGVACPFLISGKCSIYEHRPFACRVFFSMTDDEVLCEIFPGEDISAPFLDYSEYSRAQIAALGPVDALKNADIRDFFKPT